MAILDTLIDLGTSWFGAQSEANARNAQLDLEYEQAKKVSKYNWKESLREYNYSKRGVKIQRNNIEQEYAWRDATAQQDYRYQLAIADVTDRMNQAAYAKSVQTYGMQLGFNNMAAASAYAAEQRKIQEAVTEMSFQNQDITIQALQEAGNVQASGVSGRSAGKAVHAVLAQAGRNQAILAESLVSAEANFRQTNDKITSDKYGADLQAFGNLMVKPIASARPDAPLSMPRPKLQNPMRPKKPPGPVRGVSASATPGIIKAVGDAAVGVNNSFGAGGNINWT
jgi:hypothetical protein